MPYIERILSKKTKYILMKNKTLFLVFALLLTCDAIIYGQDAGYLFRSVSQLTVSDNELSTSTAHYKPIFGAGDKDSAKVKDVKRYGHLSIDANGKSKFVKYKREEQIYFILEGTGILHYGKMDVPVSKNDFVYLPAGVKHGLSNPRENELKVMVMGYVIPFDSVIVPTKGLPLASADVVPLQVAGKHPASTKFKLMMGTYLSTRDKIATAYQMNSLFIMDFEPGATNNPHQHPFEEEIYYVLRGHGEMVAGGTKEAENRIPAKEGDIFFFAPNTLVGFYNDPEKCAEHALILAVRSKYAK
jgi:mannose-6-phosphate isomerase-like protein (cupin superfamily)